MPIYEYRCTKCGLEEEVLQKLSDPPLTQCPTCGEATMTKLVSAVGFQLKGTGWYATDFKNSGSKPPAKADASKSDSTKSEASKSEDGVKSAPAESASGKTEVKAPAVTKDPPPSS